MAFAALVAASAAAATSAAVPVPVDRVLPDYPAAAVSTGLTGQAKVRLVIDARGLVTAASLIEETPQGVGFGDAALAAGRRWTFEAGKPGSFVITMQFVPSDGSPGIDIATLPKAPKPIKRVMATYPMGAEASAARAQVFVIVRIAEDGSVAESIAAQEVPSGKGFGKAALNAVNQWKFEPGRPGLYSIAFRFMMEGDKEFQVAWQDLPRLPAPVSRIDPVYPEGARAESETGRLKVAVTVAEDGTVARVNVVTERPKEQGFAEAARTALFLWRFQGVPPDTYRLELKIEPPAS